MSSETATVVLPPSHETVQTEADPPYLLRGVSASPAQRWHAWLILLLPTVAVAVAAGLAVGGHLRPWQPLLALGLYLLTILAITVSFHRQLSHRAFKAGPVLTGLFAIIGSMAAQGPPIYWVSNHRRHHRYVDRDGDPHSPGNDAGRPLQGLAGFWHAHAGWTFGHRLSNSIHLCPDLLQNRTLTWVNRHYFKWVALGLIVPTLLGYAIEGSLAGAGFGLLWGGGVRLFITYHLTNAINSVTHLWGYRNYDTRDSSRNSLWLGLLTLGEGWHNNHHADPAAARFGRRWWEIDLGWLLIALLGRLGLARDIRRPGRGVVKADEL
ncbi:acyl-CoA desaturase [Chitinimonas lacunae]|uniref:Acyl-CoA desaturase n=1 Tax=Chitinimonas lacunae TaxID=1963018 RepID=A0ABV8MUW3_9NEIS